MQRVFPCASRRVAPAFRGLGSRGFSSKEQFVAPPMVYIKGEEMSRYTMQLVLDNWVAPYIDTANWEFIDLSCKSRDDTDDQCLRDAVDAGKRIAAIFKEPTITPTPSQQKELGLKKAFGSPNGHMRRGWNGITISRDTIHIPGVALGYKQPVLCERHAVGGEYGAGWDTVGKGRVLTTFFPEDMRETKPKIIDAREITDETSAVVVYDNPLDNVTDLGHVFFKRCLEKHCVPYVVTKKTVFKWQEPFWAALKDLFDAQYREEFLERGLLDKCGGELRHLISDAATMQIIRWTDGGFGMACHNYDGDMLTDEVSQVHRSPGFITSSLIGKREDGSFIKQFEASHGTVADLWKAHLAEQETSMNPLGMVVALLDAMDHAATLDPTAQDQVLKWTTSTREAMYKCFREGRGTRDMVGPSGLTTEGFIDAVKIHLDEFMEAEGLPKPFVEDETIETKVSKPSRKFRRNYDADEEKMRLLFEKYNVSKNNSMNFEEFMEMMVDLGVAPVRDDKMLVQEVRTKAKISYETP
eukprot:TRINITY_DN41555_c0_g1_i1.p1 TRINITY_DN41555_c0_g1~~TRINITY_DN41555_c0_g1_i1.p1  ORF type:complete len:548 (+),score=93.37 TRINITY_DN41555_c0_g1_i1:69-1646(+)